MSTTSWFLIGLNCGLAIGAFACLAVAYGLTRKPVGRAPEYASNGTTAGTLAATARAFSQPMVSPLTERQVEVLKYAAMGLSNIQIANEMDVTIQTVKYHLGEVYGRLGVKNRTSAIRAARELGVLA